MIVVDWMSVAFGLAIGGIISAAFFWGLGLGMRFALRTEQPVRILALSAFVRIATLLGVGWAVATFLGPFALAGFAAAFFIARTVATARASISAEGAP